MALGALSREEPGAAAPAERKSQNKGAPLGSTRWTFPFKSDAMLADPIRPSEQSRDNKHHMNPGRARQVVRYSGAHHDS